MLLQISSQEMEDPPKIDEAIESLTEMSRIFDKILVLADYLDRMVETENTLDEAKKDVKSFIRDFENTIKDFTTQEMILTAHLRGNIDLSKIDLKTEEKTFEKGESSQSSQPLSLRPNTSKAKPIFEKREIIQEPEILKLHTETMEKLYNLSDTDLRIVDKSGIYPRVYFLQGSNPEEIREWYDFGSLATIYQTTPDFPEIERLPAWIREGVMDNFANNSLIRMDDTLALDFYSASPDFENEHRFPVWHFIRMRKVSHERNMISNTKKIFKSFSEENFHYRRGLGLIVVLRQMESALKRPFRSYGKPDRLGSIMISTDCRSTPDYAKRFLSKKIHLIEAGELISSQYALDHVTKKLTEKAIPLRFHRQKLIKEESI